MQHVRHTIEQLRRYIATCEAHDELQEVIMGLASCNVAPQFLDRASNVSMTVESGPRIFAQEGGQTQSRCM
jgi:hypothetical protein